MATSFSTPPQPLVERADTRQPDERVWDMETWERLRSAVERLRDDLFARLPPEPSLQDRMHSFLAANLHRRVTLKDLSQFVGYSEKYCSEWFLARMGEPFSGYMKRLRLERATRLLSSPGRLADIAETLGFHDQYAFSHFFKKATGVSPHLFRQGTGRAPRRPTRSTRCPSGPIRRGCPDHREERG